MSSHFATIGLRVESPDDFVSLAKRAARNAKPFEVSNGRYMQWSSQSGAELWLQFDRDNNFIGMTPHFTGESRVRTGITARVNRPNDTPLDGAFHAWAEPSDGDPEDGTYPFVFDTPDYGLYSEMVVPCRVEARIAAFAHEINVFESEEAFDASEGPIANLASKSFIPSGLFTPGGQPTQPPEAHGILTGHITKTESRQNELTGKEFHWALVESLGGMFDIVIAPELLKAPLTPGGVLSGSFWLSGRVSDFPRKEKGLFRRLFGRG